MERILQNLIKELKTETGIGKIKILLIHLQENINSLDILALIVWMLYLWLFIQYGLLVHLSNVHY